MTILDEVRAIKKQSAQRKLIEAALLRDKTISNGAAWEGVYGDRIRRLAPRISELRKEGWQIRTEETPEGECYYHLVSTPAPKQQTLTS